MQHGKSQHLLLIPQDQACFQIRRFCQMVLLQKALQTLKPPTHCQGHTSKLFQCTSSHASGSLCI